MRDRRKEKRDENGFFEFARLPRSFAGRDVRDIKDETAASDSEERERQEAYREAFDTLLENIPEKSPQGTSVIVSGNGGDSELELPDATVKEPEDWRCLFERPSVRSKTKQFLEMATRFNAKDVGFGRENDTLLVLPSVGIMSVQGR